MDKSKGVRIDEFRSDPIEAPLRVDIGPTSRERERESRPQATQTSHPVLIDQDVPLEANEYIMLVYGKRRCTILTFPWMISSSCIYFNAREIPTSYRF